MPKILNYPRNSFEKSLEIAEAAFDLGGTCDEQTCADKLGKSVSGGFKSIIASAQKFNLIEFHRGIISCSDSYNLIQHAYSEDEKRDYLIQSFLSPDVFRELFDRFEGKRLPFELLDRMLIREYGVEQKIASRVSKYFMDGLKSLELLDSSNILSSFRHGSLENEHDFTDAIAISTDSITKTLSRNDEDKKEISTQEKINSAFPSNGYVVHITGPGLNTRIEILEEDDLDIVETTLKKVKRKIKDMEGNTSNSREIL